jgi:acyl-coenzyme A synthetase/AMP-(fatty) acid ligase
MVDWREARRLNALWSSPDFPPPFAPPADATGVLLATSGTSGERRWVLHPWSHLEAAARRDPDTRPLISFLSPTHAAGLELAMQVELSGRLFHTVPFPWREEDLARAPFAPQVAALTPATLWRLLATHAGKALLSKLAEVRVGGEALAPALAQACALTFPQLLLRPVFGTTETWGVGCHHVGGGEVVFDDDVARAESHEGELQITTPLLATHAFDRTGYIQTLTGPWLTGDLLEPGTHGGLRFLPRAGRVGKVAGIKFLAPELEADLVACLGVPWAQVLWLSCPMLGQRPRLVFPQRQSPNARVLREWAARWKLPLPETGEAPFPQPDGRGKTR